MSKLEKLSDKVLKKIVDSLHQEFEEEGIVIYEDRSSFEISTLDSIDSVVRLFGIDTENFTETDYSFFIALCRLNRKVDDELKRPKLDLYDVDFAEHSVQYVTSIYEHKINSYLPLTKQIVHSLENASFIEYWEGRSAGHEVTDSETNDVEVYSIRKLNRR